MSMGISPKNGNLEIIYGKIPNERSLLSSISVFSGTSVSMPRFAFCTREISSERTICKSLADAEWEMLRSCCSNSSFWARFWSLKILENFVAIFQPIGNKHFELFRPNDFGLANGILTVECWHFYNIKTYLKRIETHCPTFWRPIHPRVIRTRKCGKGPCKSRSFGLPFPINGSKPKE